MILGLVLEVSYLTASPTVLAAQELPQGAGSTGLPCAFAPLEHGHDLRTVHELLGHPDANWKIIYTHAPNRGPVAVQGPADRMLGLCRCRVLS